MTLFFISSFLISSIIFQAQVGMAAEDTEAPAIIDIEEISLEDILNMEVVSATKKTQKISEAPAIISVITARQIKERGYQSVGEALQSVAGLDLLHDHLQYNLGVRGINGGMRAWSRIVKVMIDGQPVSYRPSSENFLGEELIPIAVVDRIEVVRGPGSALYGANAFLGVINIITKSGEQVEWGEVSGRFGTQPDKGVSAVVGSKIGDLDFIAAGTLSETDRSGLVPENVPGQSLYSSYDKSEGDIAEPLSFFAKAQYENEDMGRFVVDMHVQRMDSYAEFMDWGVLTHNNRVSIENYYVRGKYSLDFLDDFSGTFSVAYAEGGPTSDERLDIDSTLAEWITGEVGYDGIDIAGELRYDLDDRNSFTVGCDYTAEDHDLQTYFLNDDSGLHQANSPGELGDRTFRNTGIYAQAILYPFEMLETDYLTTLGLTAGLRYDIHNYYEDVVNYRVAGVYQVIDDVYVKLLYGTSFKAPSSVQLYSNTIISSGVVGNEDLEPEKAKTLEGAVGAQVTDNMSLTVNGYYNTIEDKVELVLPYGTIPNVTPENVAEISSLGLECEMMYRWKDLLSYVNYSYQESLVKKQDLIRGEIKIDTDLYPTHMVKFGANYRVPDSFLNLNLEGRFIDSRRASESNTFLYDPVNYRTSRYELGSYFLLDLAVSTYNLKLVQDKETEMSVKVYNILDEEYLYPGFSAVPGQNGFDIPGSGRSIVFTISQHF